MALDAFVLVMTSFHVVPNCVCMHIAFSDGIFSVVATIVLLDFRYVQQMLPALTLPWVFIVTFLI